VNAPLRRTFYLFVGGFVALIGVLAYWQVYAQESLANDPANSLQSQRALETPRGLILAGDGETVLARSEEQESEGGSTTYDRVYPEGPLYGNITGYWSTRYGATGIEVGENTNLSGGGDPATLDDLINQATGGPEAGNNVVLTIDPELQRTAYEALANSNTGQGSAMALDPQTGEILALASYPSYDPNDIDENFEELAEDPDAPLLDRATQGLYAPGSTFKVVTAAAALEAGVDPNDEFFDSGEYETPGYTVINYRNEDRGEVTFTEALVFSINVIFAEIAVEIVGPEALAGVAQAFGFGDDYENFPLPVSASDLGLPPSEWAPGYTAQVAFGQGQVVSNVFQMALVSAAVANDGEVMDPTLVREIRSSDGVLLDTANPRVRERAIPEETANDLGGMMESVVQDGNLVNAQVAGMRVAGKTGTAEAPEGEPHSWFISYAPADDPEIAVAVMVENGGVIDDEGYAATPAVSIAGEMMRTYLDRPAPAQQQQGQQPGSQQGQPPAGPAQPGQTPQVPQLPQGQGGQGQQGPPGVQDVLPEGFEEDLPFNPFREEEEPSGGSQGPG
jgi:penicillin-binding protein A